MENISETPEPAAPKPQTKPDATKNYLTIVILAIALIIVLAVAFGYWKVTRKMQSLEQQVSSLSYENTRLKTATPPAPAEKAPPLASTPAPAASLAEAPKESTGGNDNYRLSVVVAVADVREELQSGKPFIQKMSIVTALLKNDPVALPYIETLQPLAERGVPNHEILKKDFEVAREKIMLLGHGLPANPTFMDRLAYSFSKVIRIRKVSQEVTAPKDNNIIMDEAASALDTGNVAQALQITESITNAEAKALAASWIDEASTFLKAQDAIYNLYSHIASPAYSNQAIIKESQE